MAIRVQVPGHGLVEFPDGMSQDDMRAAIESLDAPQTAALPTGDIASPQGEAQMQAAVRSLGAPSAVLKHAATQTADTAMNAAPAVGAAGAVLATGGTALPAIAAAALGGAGGEGVRDTYDQLRTGVPSSPKTILGRMVTQGAIAAGTEGAAAGIRAAAPSLAKRLYGFALKPTLALRNEFEDLIPTGISEGISVGAKGADAAQQAIADSTKQAQAILAAREAARPDVAGYLPTATEDVPLGVAPTPQGGSPALQPAVQTMPRKVGPVGNTQELLLRQWEPVYGGEGVEPPTAVADTVAGPGVLRRRLGVSEAPAGPGAPPGMIDPRAIAQTGLGPVASDLSDRALNARDTGQLQGLVDQFLATHQTPLTLTEANALKGAEQDQASQFYRALDRGAPPNGVEPQFHAGIASGARRQIEQIAPEVAPVNARTQRLIGLSRAIDRRVGLLENNSPVGMQHLINASIGAGAYGASGGNTDRGLGTFLALEGLTNPAIASRLAIGLGGIGPRNLGLAQLVRAAVMARLSGGSPSTGTPSPTSAQPGRIQP